jgi:hypothetical protein
LETEEAEGEERSGWRDLRKQDEGKHKKVINDTPICGKPHAYVERNDGNLYHHHHRPNRGYRKIRYPCLDDRGGALLHTIDEINSMDGGVHG